MVSHLSWLPEIFLVSLVTLLNISNCHFLSFSICYFEQFKTLPVSSNAHSHHLHLRLGDGLTFYSFQTLSPPWSPASNSPFFLFHGQSYSYIEGWRLLLHSGSINEWKHKKGRAHVPARKSTCISQGPSGNNRRLIPTV